MFPGIKKSIFLLWSFFCFALPASGTAGSRLFQKILNTGSRASSKAAGLCGIGTRLHPGWQRVLAGKSLRHLHMFCPVYLTVGVSTGSFWYLYSKETVQDSLPGEKYKGTAQLPGMDLYDMETGVRWFQEEEKAQFKIYGHQGLIVDAGGIPLDMKAKGIFTMNKKGEIFVYEYRVSALVDQVRHSSLSGGRFVAGAGEIFIEKGLIREVNNISGHYWPSPDFHAQVLVELGILTGIDLTIWPSVGGGGIVRHYAPGYRVPDSAEAQT